MAFKLELKETLLDVRGVAWYLAPLRGTNMNLGQPSYSIQNSPCFQLGPLSPLRSEMGRHWWLDRNRHGHSCPSGYHSGMNHLSIVSLYTWLLENHIPGWKQLGKSPQTQYRAVRTYVMPLSMNMTHGGSNTGKSQRCTSCCFLSPTMYVILDLNNCLDHLQTRKDHPNFKNRHDSCGSTRSWTLILCGSLCTYEHMQESYPSFKFLLPLNVNRKDSRSYLDDALLNFLASPAQDEGAADLSLCSMP
ncbi:hypothetical protein VNO77_34608 [Canavalia gladiata]|uniref:Uncharacterized protein n=1 Tax=Canavalia gladiata TaxID=3824 RepID=A0AAN9KEI0_CANGL